MPGLLRHGFGLRTLGRGRGRVGVALLVLLLGSALLTGCGSAPQVDTVSPGRGSGNIPSDQPVEIQFSAPMNRQSVESRFHLLPVAAPLLKLPWAPSQAIGAEVKGWFSWTSPTTMYFDHPTLHADTHYQVVLGSGFRDATGDVNSLRHSWIFQTELQLQLLGSSPGDGDLGVAVSTYLTVGFSARLDASTLQHAFTLTPQTAINVRIDPTDPYQAIIAPQGLLEPGTNYQLTVGTGIHDVHGNPLPRAHLLTFRTGPTQPLSHWVTFTGPTAGPDAASGLWIVDQSDFPRRLLTGAVQSATWSPDGKDLIVQNADGTWAGGALGANLDPLPFQATWAAFAGADDRVAYLQNGVLSVLPLGGSPTVVATGVSEAAVAPRGDQLAYTVPTANGWQLAGYDLGLHAGYLLASASAPIDEVAWAPDGSGIAFRLRAVTAGRRELRVRSLSGAGGTTTVATGDIANPRWEPDARHLLYTEELSKSAGMRIYRQGIGQEGAGLGPTTGLPAGSTLHVLSYDVSADGRQIAFVADQKGQRSVWLMNADGSGLQQLTNQPGSPFSWAPGPVSWTPI
ncbi:MAG: Ig-like domain-containing protein [Candidatus Dormiibacterota bacterium]